MEDDKVITIQFKLTRNKALVILAAFFLCWHPRDLGSETLTLTTYYPAPYGGYSNLLTTGKTLLARDPTSTSSDSNFVGVGTNDPQVKLHVQTFSSSYASDDEVARFSAVGNGLHYIQVDAGTAGTSKVTLLANTSNGGVGSKSTHDFYLRTNDQDRVRVDATTGKVGMGPSPATFTPYDYLHIKGTGNTSTTQGNFRIEGGNLVFGSPTGLLATPFTGTGFIAGLCQSRTFSNSGRVDCLGVGERIIAVYGNSCDSGGALLSLATADMNLTSSWVPHQEPNCSGTMLCCNIKDY